MGRIRLTIGASHVICFCAAWWFAAAIGVSTAFAGDQLNLRWEISSEVGKVQSLDLSHDGQLFVVAGMETPSSVVGVYELRRTTDGELIRRFRTMLDGILQVRFSPAGDRLVRMYRFGFGSEIYLEGIGTVSDARSFSAWAPAPDHATVAVASWLFNWGRPPTDFRFDIWRVGSSTNVQLLHTWAGWAPNAVAFSPDGKFLAADGSLLDASDGSGVRSLQWEGFLSSLNFSRDGKFVYGAHNSGVVRVCSVADGGLYTRISAYTNAVTGLGLALNGRAIATANGQAVKLWSREGGVLLRDLGQQAAGAADVKVTEDGTILIAARSDGRIVALENPFAPKLEIRSQQAEWTATVVALQSYELQSSTNLLDWTAVTNYTSDQSVIEFPINSSADNPTRFWRLLSR